MAIRTILLAIGPMDAVRADDLAETVLEVAEPLGARVVIAHAFTEAEYEEVRDRLGFEEPASRVDPDEVARRREPAGEIATALEEAGVEYEIRGAMGDHASAVVDLAEEVEADRIVVGGRQRSPADKVVLGSTSQDILLSAPCPTVFVRDRSVME